jgi:hypothetical protein
MTRGAFLKFLFLSQSNLKRFVTVNLLLLLPLSGLCFSLYELVPRALRLLDSFNIGVEWVREGHDRLVIAVVTGKLDRVYVFQREDFNGLRRYLFSSPEENRDLLEEAALASGVVLFYGKPQTFVGKNGEPLLTLTLEQSKENVIQVLYYRKDLSPYKPRLAFSLGLFLVSFVLLFGSLGGVSDFTQRVVFHEMKSFSYLFIAIGRFFWRSLLVSLFFAVVIGAIGTNVYFYIFIIAGDFSVFIAALNFWMLIFFLFILFWVFPLLILNLDESVWRVMKKSLFISLDNFEFTMDCFIFSALMLIVSSVTLFCVPGIAGFSSFKNSALKDISHRYTQSDTP